MAKIDLNDAKAMVQHYVDTKLVLIDGTYKMNDTKSIWFSIEQVKAFMDTLTPDTTGVRIYLAAYGDKDAYPNQTTVVAIGTKLDPATSRDVDSISHDVQSLTGDGGTDPYNTGKLCPPIC